MESSKLKIHMIANNHIDREWTYDSQLTRMITVKFFEDLIETFEAIPEFQFVLDSQTVPLEDFLELFPEKRETLRKYVSEKRLWIGPWYTAPDSFYLNGESLVRNLLTGHRVAESFGNVSKFGYTPFGWGQISQLPQIYSGFGIDTIFFYRGADTIDANCYHWVGADGTAAYCVKYGRTNFFDKVFRPMTKNRQSVPWDRELDYLSDEVPFMFSSDENKYEHGFIAGAKFHIKDFNTIKKTVDEFAAGEKDAFPGNIALGMNGMDTCFPPLKGLLAIDEVKEAGSGDYELVYSCLDAFSGELKQAVKDGGAVLERHCGEMRRFLAGFGGKGKSEAKSTHFYIAAARPEQKSKNAKAENLLTRYAEPFAAMGSVLGAAYPGAYLTAAWKSLLKCHPHDTIAGCGADQIQTDMLGRLDQTINISKAVLNMSAQHIVRNIDNRDVKDGEIALIIFNPSPFRRRDAVELWLHIPESFGFGSFEITEKHSGRPVGFEVLSRGEMEDRIFRDLTDTSLYAYGELVKVLADVEIGGLGYKTLIVREAEAAQVKNPGLAGDMQMENKRIKVCINKDGTLNIMCKETGLWYNSLHYFTDTGDNGDPWVRFVPDGNRLHSSRGKEAKVRLIENSPLRAAFEIEYDLMVPAGLEKEDYIMEGYFNKTRSSDKLIPLPVKSVVSITGDSGYVDVRTEIVNCSTDHLVQVNFPTSLSADKVYAESGFDVVERSIKKNTEGLDPSLVNGEDPFVRFIDMSDGINGLSILSDSVKGYEPLGDDENTVALNLIRSYTSQIVTIYGRKERRPDFGLTQAQGLHRFHYAIYPHSGGWENGCAALAEHVNYPLMPVQTHRSFGDLPCELDFIKIDSDKLVLSAVKKAERSDDFIIRVYNPGTEPAAGALELFRDIAAAGRVNLNEEPVGGEGVLSHSGRKLHMNVGAKKIETVMIRVES